MKDLVILAADKDLEFAFNGLLARPESLNIHELMFDIFVEPEHDPACVVRGVEFLSHLSTQYRRALPIFDHEGSGDESMSWEDLKNSSGSGRSQASTSDSATTGPSGLSAASQTGIVNPAMNGHRATQLRILEELHGAPSTSTMSKSPPPH